MKVDVLKCMWILLHIELTHEDAMCMPLFFVMVGLNV
jgi:hypothetical protein